MSLQGGPRLPHRQSKEGSASVGHLLGIPLQKEAQLSVVVNPKKISPWVISEEHWVLL